MMKKDPENRIAGQAGKLYAKKYSNFYSVRNDPGSQYKKHFDRKVI
jgi:hypothetical protein